MVLIYILAFIFGISLGSFTKVLADRSLRNVTFRGRSYCEICKKKLHWYDLFPVFSYLLLHGKCRYCHKKIPLEYVLVEIFMGVLAVLVVHLNIPANFLNLSATQLSLIGLDLIFKIFAVCILVALILTDLKKYLIPDRITYPAVLIALIFLILVTIYKIVLIYFSLTGHPIGQFLLPPYSDYFFRHSLDAANPLIYGLLSSFGLGLFFWLVIFITRGKGMGGGDLKLGVFMGLVLGFPNCLLALILAFLSGSIVGIGLMIFGKKGLKDAIPFGPFLSLASITALLFGERIIKWYLYFRF